MTAAAVTSMVGRREAAGLEAGVSADCSRFLPALGPCTKAAAGHQPGILKGSELHWGNCWPAGLVCVQHLLQPMQ